MARPPSPLLAVALALLCVIGYYLTTGNAPQSPPTPAEEHRRPSAAPPRSSDQSLPAPETAYPVPLPLPETPAYRDVLEDPVLYAHASRILHLEANPGNARALVQRHGNDDGWLNPPKAGDV